MACIARESEPMNWKLEKHPSFPGVEGPVVVCVMDGVGIGRRDESDAVWLAQTPHLDRLAQTVPTTSLRAHGQSAEDPPPKRMTKQMWIRPTGTHLTNTEPS